MSKIIGWSFLGLALFAVWIKLDTGLSFVVWFERLIAGV